MKFIRSCKISSHCPDPRSLWRAALLPAAFAILVAVVTAQNLAPTPPMGWNSWDAYGLTINEAEFMANVTVLASLKQYGWQYAVIDEGWYMENPSGANLAARKYVYDANGLLVPVTNRFPSAANGQGFKPLADWVHGQGLKFGTHIVRGIPKSVVKANLPIAGSSYRAAEAADTSNTCPWDEGNYGVSDNPAGQAYYDSMFKEFAAWGMDFIKVDCISDHPYRPSEIRQIATAISHSGRAMVLSLSPGPASIENASELAKYAQMWRISDDHWDGWSFPKNPNNGEFPFGLSEAFDRLEKWNPHTRPGSWPDEDMLPFGSLRPHPGWGAPRQSRITHDEERTEFTLWAFARSPLILGANLTQLDDFTRSLLTDRDVIAVNQHGSGNHPVKNLPPGFEHVRVWEAHVDQSEYFAFFNLDDKPVTLHFKWEQLGYRGKSKVRNLYEGGGFQQTAAMETTIPAHGSTVYQFQSR